MIRRFFDPERTRGFSTINKIYVIIGVFLLVAVFMIGLQYASGTIAEGVRAYVRGEGLWAKAQKDAVTHLGTYIETRDPREYDLFLEHVQVIDGDRQARMALSQDPPDRTRARLGFLAGQNAPEDVDRMISFYLYFHDFPYMNQAIRIWRAADAKIDELTALAWNIHTEIRSADPDEGRLAAYADDMAVLGTQLHDLETRFSLVLGEGARWVWRTTFAVGLFMTSVFLLIGLVIAARVIRSISRDIAAKNRLEAEIRRQSREDPLTGLANRKEFCEKLDEHAKLALREGTLLGVLYMDLDKFKPINDGHGHAVGDAVLQAVAENLKRHVRETDVLARIGGDEFAVVLVHPQNRQEVAATAERIVDAICEPVTIGGQQLQVGMSAGGALFPDDDVDQAGLLHKADAALYRAKHEGRGVFRFFDADATRAR